MRIGQIAAGVKEYRSRIAFVDVSKGARKKLVISDLDGLLREANKEELIHRSWKRKELRKNEYLLRKGL